jgi:hypothetical protein
LAADFGIKMKSPAGTALNRGNLAKRPVQQAICLLGFFALQERYGIDLQSLGNPVDHFNRRRVFLPLDHADIVPVISALRFFACPM